MGAKGKDYPDKMLPGRSIGLDLTISNHRVKQKNLLHFVTNNKGGSHISREMTRSLKIPVGHGLFYLFPIFAPQFQKIGPVAQLDRATAF